jgi:hypothetical protein
MKNTVVIVACSFRLSSKNMQARLKKLTNKYKCSSPVFIISSQAQKEQDMGNGWTLLPADNIDFDFSAYFVGAEAVLTRHPDAKAVLFINDTLFTNHAAEANFKAVWRHVGLIQEIEIPAIAGKADRYTTICLKNPWSGLDSYISTFCFLLNIQGLEIMGQLRIEAAKDDITFEHSLKSSAWGARLPSAFRQFLKANLLYRSSPYLWYRLRNNIYTDDKLLSKSRTIYFEHRISGEIGRLGCLVPSNAGSRWNTYLAVHELCKKLSGKLYSNL